MWCSGESDYNEVHEAVFDLVSITDTESTVAHFD